MVIQVNVKALLETFARENDYNFWTDSCAARVSKGDPKVENQVLWGTNYPDGTLFILATRSSDEDAHALRQFFIARKIPYENDVSTVFTTFRVPQNSLGELVSEYLKPKKDRTQATKPKSKTKQGLCGIIKQLCGKVNRTYGMMLNHPTEIRNALENYCYVEHDIGHSDFSMNEDRSVNRITRYAFDAKFVARIFRQHEKAIQKVDSQQKIIFLDSHVRASPPILIYNASLWDHTYYCYFVHKDLISNMDESKVRQFLFDDELKGILKTHRYDR